MKNLFIFLIVISPFIGLSQTDSTQWKLKLNPCKIGVGYIYQGQHLLETGVKIDYIKTNTKGKTKGENLSVLIGGQLNWYNQTSYLNPFSTLRYLKPINKNVGVKFSLSYSFSKVNSLKSNTLTPEIGINFNSINTLSYGYNIFLDNKLNQVTKNRIVFRAMLF